MKRMVPICLALILMLIVAGCQAPAAPGLGSSLSPQSPAEGDGTQEESNEGENASGEEALPNNEWEFGAPADYGVDSARLAQIDQRMAGSQILGAVIVKDGVIIDEFYQEGYDEASLFHMHSVTKSVMGALTGIAIEQGVLEGVDVKLAEFFPQLALPANAGKEDITVRHLLTHTAGLGEGDSSSFRALMQAENWVDYYLSQPLNYEPGTTFRYSTAGSHMLSAVLERAAGIPAEDFAVANLFRPLGIENYEWGKDPQGVVDGGNGLHLSVRDAAKLGQLFLDGGNWRGRQLVPEDWVAESTVPHAQGESDKGRYGYQWWVWTFGGHDVYYALGYAGQFIFVVPDLNIVTAIASKSIWSDFTGQVCIGEVIAACE